MMNNLFLELHSVLGDVATTGGSALDAVTAATGFLFQWSRQSSWWTVREGGASVRHEGSPGPLPTPLLLGLPALVRMLQVLPGFTAPEHVDRRGRDFELPGPFSPGSLPAVALLVPVVENSLGLSFRQLGMRGVSSAQPDVGAVPAVDPLHGAAQLPTGVAKAVVANLIHRVSRVHPGDLGI